MIKNGSLVTFNRLYIINDSLILFYLIQSNYFLLILGKTFLFKSSVHNSIITYIVNIFTITMSTLYVLRKKQNISDNENAMIEKWTSFPIHFHLS